MERITIFIVDKQPIFRQGLCQALPVFEDMEVVRECSPGTDIWNRIESLSPDIALIDDQFFQAIKSGASAFLSKDIAADELAGTLRRVRWGGISHK